MDLLDRLFERLLAASEVLDAQAAAAELTIGDVYQALIPYRAVRGDLGVMELAQYEHALLRLLSGERKYVEVADPEVRQEIQRELASPSPILGIYRDYPAAGIRLCGSIPASPQVVPPDAHPEPPSPAMPSGPTPPVPFPDEVREPAATREPAPPTAAPPQVSKQAVPRLSALPAAPPVGGAPPLPIRPACHDCGKPLPGHTEVRFCPYCGAAQGPAICNRCETPLDGAWSFCVRCGAPRA